MKRQIRRIRNVAVLGSGTMGSQIAGHCVNAGLNVWLLDLKADDPSDPDKIVRENLNKLRGFKPAALGMPEFAERIQTGNFEDDFDLLGKMDWICEAVVEKMDIKRNLLKRIEDYWNHGTIVSTNTSGLPVNEISRECNQEFKKHFLGIHFFNPPRYMKLVEVIPTDETEQKVTSSMIDFCEAVLGKGVVKSHDTPNFIANRIGVFSMASILPWFFDGTLRIEEIDLLTGTLTGYSKAAVFRTADIVGIDVLKHVSENLVPAIPEDERRDVFRMPDELASMVEKGWLGKKAGQGFYKKESSGTGKEYHVLNPEQMSYEPQKEVDFTSVNIALENYETPGERLKYIASQKDKPGKFLWKIQCELLLYAANRLPEVAASTESIDRAMKWGFNWELGPFERWDFLGVVESVDQMQQEGYVVPESVLDMLASGRENFYENGTVYNLADGRIENISPPAVGAITVSILDRERKEVWGNHHAGLYDTGGGIALLEFRSYQQTVGSSLIEAFEMAIQKVKEGFHALVIGHDHENFSHGANLSELVSDISEGRKEKLKETVSRFQKLSVGLRYQPFPVVGAVSGRVLGGGAEIMMHCDKVVAHHDLYCGLVELGAGLIPGGGGTKELMLRMVENSLDDDLADPAPYIRKAFKMIGMMNVSTSAAHARELGFLRRSDLIVMNRDRLLRTARQQAAGLADSVYQPPEEPEILVLGRTGYSKLKLMIYQMRESKSITPYEAVLAEKVAWVMSGGDMSEPQKVPESYLLGLEREAIEELLDNRLTTERMEHLLKTGRQLRN